MKTILPKMGRPSKSGLSVKLLGVTEYARRRAEKMRRAKGIKPRQFTGLSPKLLGWKDYRFALRHLNKTNQDLFMSKPTIEKILQSEWHNNVIVAEGYYRMKQRVEELEGAIVNLYRWTGSKRCARECKRILPDVAQRCHQNAAPSHAANNPKATT